MPDDPTFSVGQLARLAGVSVRTLHHYDELGLLRPERRGDGGYRRYRRRDVDRLQTILAYRELGLALDDIRRVLDDPDRDPLDALRRLARELDDRATRLERMRSAVRRTLEARMKDLKLDPAEMLEVFGDHDPTAHAAEAEQRWGDTDAYRQSARRTKGYAKADWLRIRAESDAIHARLVAALHAGEPADGTTAMDAAEAYRRHVGAWFYDCSPAMHVQLAAMYEADPRFAATYEALAPGLTAYLASAIRANAARQEADA